LAHRDPLRSLVIKRITTRLIIELKFSDSLPEKTLLMKMNIVIKLEITDAIPVMAAITL